MFRINRILGRIRSDEAFESRPYPCPAGVWTIGYGTTVLDGRPVTPSTFPITKARANTLLKAGVLDAIEDVQVIYAESFWLLHSVHQEVLICLAYQLGRDGLRGFVKMNKAIHARDYGDWMKELRDSLLWREQARNRVERYLYAIEHARWAD